MIPADGIYIFVAADSFNCDAPKADKWVCGTVADNGSPGP
jgi:hypothetical protein